MTFIKIMLYQSNAQNALYHNVNKRNGGEEMRGEGVGRRGVCGEGGEGGEERGGEGGGEGRREGRREEYQQS